jgi:hypothetical protein
VTRAGSENDNFIVKQNDKEMWNSEHEILSFKNDLKTNHTSTFSDKILLHVCIFKVNYSINN